jgi:hypothetical protein
MWTATEPGNVAALATYAAAGAAASPPQVGVEWEYGGAARQRPA